MQSSGIEHIELQDSICSKLVERPLPSDDTIRKCFLVEFQSKQKFYTMSTANIKFKELISIDHTFKIASNIGYLRSNFSSQLLLNPKQA